jgi:hypothetical protein
MSENKDLVLLRRAVMEEYQQIPESIKQLKDALMNRGDSKIYNPSDIEDIKSRFDQVVHEVTYVLLNGHNEEGFFGKDIIQSTFKKVFQLGRYERYSKEEIEALHVIRGIKEDLRYNRLNLRKPRDEAVNNLANALNILCGNPK